MKKPPGAALFHDSRPLQLQFGGSLPEVEIAYETWGQLSPDRDNAIFVCPAFSAHSHARSSEQDQSEGWWEEMIGPAKALDSGDFFLICASLLGGCYGTTGPLSLDPRTDRPYGPDFPIVTVRDIVDTHVRLLDHLGIERLHAALGGSLGAMEALDLAVRYPKRVARIFAISGTARTRPYTATIRRIGRQAILRDPAFQEGRYQAQPQSGLRLARELGTIYYRSRPEFNQRFSCSPLDPGNVRIDAINFDFESYLDYQGSKAPIRFDANSYLRLSLAMDLHDIGRDCPNGVQGALAQVEAACFISGAEEDLLIPLDEQREIYDILRQAGKEACWETMHSLYGHDGFLKEFAWMTPRLRSFLAGQPCPRNAHPERLKAKISR